MDLASSSTIEVTSLALNGLSARHNALAANIANADTSNYQRSDVKFEDQLVGIIQKEQNNEKIKAKNSMGIIYSPNSMLEFQAVSNKNIYKNFNPEVFATDNAAEKANGNNVNIEYEMAELAKNGTKYTAVTTFQEKIFRGLNEVIAQGGR